jgi:hypothetical protein
MKNLLLSFAVIGLAIGCRTTDNTTVTDAEGLNAPTDCASACASACDDAAKAECSEAAKAECSGAAKAECSGAAKTECSEAKVCPISGAAIE